MEDNLSASFTKYRMHLAKHSTTYMTSVTLCEYVFRHLFACGCSSVELLTAPSTKLVIHPEVGA